MPNSLDFWSKPGIVDRVIQELVEYAIFCTDENGKVMTWNAGAERVFGFKEQEILGKPADVIFTPEDREAGVPQLEMETALAEGRAADERFHIRRGGERFWANGTLVCVRDALDKVVGFVKIIRDRAHQRVEGMSVELPKES